MIDILRAVFSTAGFEPHSVHFASDPSLMWFLVFAHAFIALAYIVLPAELFYIYFKRRDFSFSWVFIAVAFFGVWCSLTHVMMIVVFFHPFYWLQGIVDAITGVVSFGTFIAFIPATYLALKLTGPDQLRVVNERLSKEIESCRLVEEELTEKNKAIESINGEITTKNEELAKINIIMSDRESKMIELKKDLEGLKNGHD